MIERHQITDRASWLALRKQDLTASRVGALFGAHPYVTALRLYLEQSGIEFPEGDETPVMRRGRLLESAVALAVAEQFPEWKIEKANEYLRDPDLRLGATPDFLIYNDPRGLGVLQAKTAAPSTFAREWDSGKTIPFWIQLQTLTECMLTQAAFGAVAVMQVDAFNLACPVLPIPRHEGAEHRIIEAVRAFWHDVADGREPGPDYGRDAGLLPFISPRAVKDKAIDLSSDNELPIMLEQRERILEQVEALEKRKEEIETELKFKMGDAAIATGIEGFSITWKNQSRAAYTVPAKENFRVLRIVDKRVE